MGKVGGIVEDVTGINVSGDSSADRALNAQRAAAGDANATQKYIFDQQREDAQPWREAGVRAIAGMEGSDYKRDFTMKDFQADPGYAFRMAEGAKAIERSASARGGLNSGATMKALTRFGQDTASAEYSNAYNRFNADRDRRFNRLASLSGSGQTANSGVAQASQNYANQYGSNVTGVANAEAGKAMGQANQLNQLAGNASLAAIAFSDARLKKDIEPISKADIAEMRSHLKAYRFRYTDESFGKGEWVGVMAQDLEKSKLGRTLVVEDENGFKQVDMRKVMSLFLATMEG